MQYKITIKVDNQKGTFIERDYMLEADDIKEANFITDMIDAVDDLDKENVKF